MYTPLINSDSSTFDADIIQSFRDAGHCLITNPFPHHVTIMNHLRSQLDKVFESENSIKADEPWQNENLERIFNDDLGTSYFPYLAEEYMRDGEYKLAKKVCDIGMLLNPRNNIITIK